MLKGLCYEVGDIAVRHLLGFSFACVTSVCELRVARSAFFGRHQLFIPVHPHRYNPNDDKELKIKRLKIFYDYSEYASRDCLDNWL